MASTYSAECFQALEVEGTCQRGETGATIFARADANSRKTKDIAKFAQIHAKTGLTGFLPKILFIGTPFYNADKNMIPQICHF